MKIKLKESQVINILKTGYSLNEEENEFLNVLQKWAELKNDSEDGGTGAIGKAVFDALVMNPQFDYENADLKDFETIDVWPVNNTSVTSGYGQRNIGGAATRNHKGVDLVANSGTPIYSPANGVVTASRNAGGRCGGFLMIDHGKFETKYCHLKKFDVVKKGDNVTKGQLVGYTGGAANDPFKGNSMGAHLHYEVLVSGRHVNPEQVHTRLS